jgi:putative effector of murein hydrolase LrgA (UPF0299 family)
LTLSDINSIGNHVLHGVTLIFLSSGIRVNASSILLTIIIIVIIIIVIIIIIIIIVVTCYLLKHILRVRQGHRMAY